MNALTKRVAGLAIVGVVAATGFTGCAINSDDGDGDSASEATQQKQLDEARAEGRREQQLKDLQKKLDKIESGGGNSGAKSNGQSATGGSTVNPSTTSGPTSCGNGLSAGANTSCPFAQAVRENYPGSANTFEVYSAVTDRTYRMACTTSSPHVCRGGNNAAVYFP